MRKTTPIAAFKARLGEHLEGLAEGPLVVTRHGRPVAIILSPPKDPEDIDSLLLAYDPGFWEIVRTSERSKLLSSDEFWNRAEKRPSPRPSRRNPRRSDPPTRRSPQNR